MNKLRWGKFFWSDWADDPALALCSLAAQGLWMRLLCIAAQGTPYGHVNIKGRAPTIEMIAKLVRAKPSFVTRLIAELERNGVASRDASGCLVSIRQESDGKLAGIRSSAANARWHKGNGSGLHMQNTPFASTEEDREEDAKSPRKPPKGQPPLAGRRRAGRSYKQPKPSKDAFADIAVDMLDDRVVPLRKLAP